MGVHGLWRLIEPSGKPVPLETLENKVLAVDVSIWLHQAIKGFQDSKGGVLQNAHLLGIYHRVCKLLYFKIKPVFVFDGGVPVLKKQTIEKRNLYKHKNQNEANKIQEQLLSTILKHSAISKVLSDKAKAALESKTKKLPIKNDSENMYKLPDTPLDSTISSSEDESESQTSEDSSPSKQFDLHSIETKSQYFKSLPADVRHEILTDLKETRKQNSWGRLHELPSQSDDFSVYQMRRLLKRQEVQSALEEAEKEMGGHSLSLGELEAILKDYGVITSNKDIGKRIASDENTRFLLIKDVKQAIDKARSDKLALETIKEIEEKAEPDTSQSSTESSASSKSKTKADEEFDEDLKRAIALSLQEEPSTSDSTPKPPTVEEIKKNLQFSFLDEPLDSDTSDDFEDFEEVEQPKPVLSSAQNYMMEYSGLTPSEIAKIIGNNAGKPMKKAVLMQEKKAVVEVLPEAALSDDDDDSDFVEVSDPETEDVAADVPKDNNAMEIVVNPDETVDDDLFKDVFDDDSQEVAATDENSVTSTSLPGTNLVDSSDQKVEAPITAPEDIGENKSESVAKDSIPDDSNESPNNLLKRLTQYINSKAKVDTVGGKLEELDATATKKPEIDAKKPKLTEQDLQKMKDDLKNEQINLLVERSNKERLGTNITDQMYQEAQELLELFGVPYIIAPMEAEAQCAFLDDANLTDGTITDDSDIWLFGGKTVYKNFFNQAKQVMEFKAEEIKRNFKLSREQMILLALLVGSDYTTGLNGVGPVTALEILAAFPPSKQNQVNISHSQLLSGLREFHVWFKKGKGKVRASLKSKLKNVQFIDSFPSVQVVQAYLEPTVETSKEQFSWGKPNMVGLIDFAREKFGWTKLKAEEVLRPVLRRIEEKTSQKSIKEYFKTKFVVQPDLPEGTISKRVKTALDRIEKGGGDEDEDKPKQKVGRRKKKEEAGGEEAGTSKSKIGRARKKKCEQVEHVSPPKKSKVNGDASLSTIPEALKEDGEIKHLQNVAHESSQKVVEMEAQLQEMLAKEMALKSAKEAELKKEILEKKMKTLHAKKKEVIYQKELDKSQMLRAKMRAIEVFRKSKKGPGYLKKSQCKKRLPKEEAELSESSSDE